MRRAKQVLLVGCVFLVGVHSADASWFGRRKAAAQPQTAAPAAVTATSLTAIEVDGSRITLKTSGTPAYTSYSPSPNVFVVDLASTTKAESVAAPAALPAGVESVTAEEAVEMGTRLTRVSFRLNQPLAVQAAAADSSVVVTMPPPQIAEISAAPAPAVETVTPEAPRVEPVAEAHVAPASVETVAVAPLAPAAPRPSQKAKTLRRIETSGAGENVEVRITADGALTYKAFRLDAPARLVLDFTGVTNRVAQPNVALAGAVVKRVRAGQFKSAPDAVARVVVELDGKPEYHIAEDGEQLRVVFGNAAVASKTAPAVQATTASSPAVESPKPAVKTAENKTRPAQAASSVDVTAQVPTIAEDARWKMPAQTSRKEPKAVISNPAADQAPPDTRTRRTTTTTTTTAPAAENVFSEPQAPTAATGGTVLSTPAQGGRTLSGGDRIYNGEPIDLNLQGADIRDVLRTFATITGLNIAVDPQVSGTVNVSFVGVPWDQALDLILRQNGLQYVLEGNVMRVGTVDRLAQETAASRRLEEERRLNVQTVTVIFKLSYARAQEVAGLLTQLGSPRARVIVDARTNQLIVTEIPQYLQTLRNLIETVDIPTRQVMIEARIVEASKLFQQTYGFQFGFSGAFDPALGSGTGLTFPNRVGFEAGPFNFGPGNPVLALHLTDVLGAFNLDFALNAFEFEGLVKVISAPRVTTQDNTPAEIQSGFQIPYQTRVNFTTTVTYLDATMRLAVTPQITEAGTVIMDIQVQKNEPTTGLAFEGASGSPLSTRTAKTRLMVRDGGTAVIGGIYQVKDNQGQQRLPLIHQIPVIGNLFKEHRINVSHDELLIFITPRIIRGV